MLARPLRALPISAPRCRHTRRSYINPQRLCLPFVKRPIVLSYVSDAVQRAVIEELVELIAHAGLQQLGFRHVGAPVVRAFQTVEHCWRASSDPAGVESLRKNLPPYSNGFFFFFMALTAPFVRPRKSGTKNARRYLREPSQMPCWKYLPKLSVLKRDT